MPTDRLEAVLNAAGDWSDADEVVLQGEATHIALAAPGRLLVLRTPPAANIGLAMTLGRALLAEVAG